MGKLLFVSCLSKIKKMRWEIKQELLKKRYYSRVKVEDKDIVSKMLEKSLYGGR